ncbi:MAG: hypothetical protein ABR589_10090, partial [Chthoniobacterales bacterium]
ARAARLTGVLGAEFLRTCSAVVDLQNLRLYLRPPGRGRRAVISPALRASGLAEVSFHQTAQNDCLVEVEINGVAGQMLLDTGAYHAAADIRLAAKLKARPIVTRRGHPRPDEFETLTRIDAAGSEAAVLVKNAPMTPLQSFKIGGVPVRAPDIRLRKFPFNSEAGSKPIGVLGVDILGANGAIIDFGERKLYFLKL